MRAPAFQFYVMDWTSDLDDHPLEIEGAWIRICCKLWRAEERGELIKSIVQWSRILRIDIEKTKEILNYISIEKIGDVTPRNIFETKNNEKITVKNRRMVRERIDKENNRLRQTKWRKKSKSNVKSNAKITPPTSSSTSSSPSRTVSTGPKAGFLNFNGGVYLDQIVKKMSLINKMQSDQRGDKKINIFAWVNSNIKNGAHPKALDYSLDNLILKWDVAKKPYAYIEGIFKSVNPDFWEKEHIEESNQFKSMWTEIDGQIQNLVQGIGNMEGDNEKK